MFEDESKNFDYDLQEIQLNSDAVKVTACNDKDNQSCQNLLKGDQTPGNIWVVDNFQKY